MRLEGGILDAGSSNAVKPQSTAREEVLTARMYSKMSVTACGIIPGFS